MATNVYRAEDYSKQEQSLVRRWRNERDDAKNYFFAVIKPRLERSYKLYIADNTDRAKQIKKWQANIAVPYVQAVVETLKPRILDARPEFTVQGRTQDDQVKSPKLQQLADFTWETSKMDATSEKVVDSSLIFGMGYLQASWKKDVREFDFLDTQDISKKKLSWIKKKKTFYDGPYAEWVDNFALIYDWHNVDKEDKQYWMKRKVSSEKVIKRAYPGADKKRMEMALNSSPEDISDWGKVRNEVKLAHERITKGSDYGQSGSGLTDGTYQSDDTTDMKMHEVYECWWPFRDKYAVFVNNVPVFKGGEMPNPYDFKESPFIPIPYLLVPGEFEGYGIPLLLENPQIMLNMIKNQRLDSMTLSIHKMWVVNPLANVNKEELVTRPFGIIYSPDPAGVREVQFSDIKASAYKEEELLKSDMRYTSGVDDFSMGAGGSAGSATEVRHMRESTLERVRLYVNHLGSGYADLLRYWISMYKQFFTKDMTIRVIGESGEILYPLIEKDDLMGYYDFKASVLPSIAGQNDVLKKQDMDLFQLLIEQPFIDPQKLTSKVLHDFNWDMESIKQDQQQQQGQPVPPGMEGMVGPDGMPMPGVMPPGGPGGAPGGGSEIPAGVAKMLGMEQNPMDQLGSPVNLLESGAPPTPKGIPSGGANSRGMNRGGKVNTNIPQKAGNGPEAQLMNRAQNIQR